MALGLAILRNGRRLSSSIQLLPTQLLVENDFSHSLCYNILKKQVIPTTASTAFHTFIESSRIAKSGSTSTCSLSSSSSSATEDAYGQRIQGNAHRRNVKIKLCDENKTVNVSWTDNGQTQSYPYVWLRDICRCEKCFHPSSKSRVADFTALDPEVFPQNLLLTETEEDTLFIVTWSDGHNSEYSTSWLRKYQFKESSKDTIFEPNVRYWGADVKEKQLRFFDFNDLLTSENTLYEWLLEIQELGLTVVKNTPRETGQLQLIGNKVAFLRPCNYGPTFQVKSKEDASNAAYTSGWLPMHTDLAYYIWAPGILLLRCIDQAKGTGGENILADGFKAAEELKKEDPVSYNILTSTVLEFYDIGTDHFGKYHQHSRHPTIRLDDGGRVAGIYWSDHGRDPMLRIATADVLPLYRAMKTFHNKLYHPSNLFKYKMDNGDILCFNNRRTLHGRAAFTTTETSNRHLEGGYLEWDEVNSKIRVLREELENDKNG